MVYLMVDSPLDQTSLERFRGRRFHIIGHQSSTSLITGEVSINFIKKIIIMTIIFASIIFAHANDYDVKFGI